MDIVFLIGRILFGLLLAFMALNHFMQMNDMSGYARAKGVPAARPAVVGSGVVLLLGGLGILLGIYPRISVLLLAIFFVPVTLMVHNFWAVEDPQAKQLEMVNFLKNAVILGAALMALGIPLPWPYAFNVGL